MKKLLLSFLLLSPTISNATFVDWATTNLTANKARILRSYIRACAFIPGGCPGWAQKTVGLYVQGTDGTGIWLSTSTALYNDYTVRNVAPGGCWNYDGSSWCGTSAGTGTRYYGNLCQRGWTLGNPLATKTIWSGTFTRGALCNFSPYLDFPPPNDNPEWFDSNVCMGSQQIQGIYEGVYTGADSRNFAVLTCYSLAQPVGTFSEFNSIELTGPWPLSSTDNAEIVATLSQALDFLNESSTDTLVSYGSQLGVDIEASIADLTDGITTTEAIGVSQTFDNPFSGINRDGSVTPVTVNVNVVSSVTVDLGPLFTSSTDYVEDFGYSVLVSSGWAQLVSFTDTMVGAVSGIFNFENVLEWDGCFTFAWTSVSYGTSPISADKTFCLGDIPGWNSTILGFIRFGILLTTLFSCLWWLF